MINLRSLVIAVCTIGAAINLKGFSSSKLFLPVRDEAYEANNSIEASKQKRTVHVLYGLSGADSGFFSEFEISLKSVLMNSPLDSNLKVHIMADQEAYTALADSFERTQIATWTTRNQVTVETYNVQSNVKKWVQVIKEYLPSVGHHTVGAFFRLFVQDVVESSVDHVLYLDTDVVVTAHLDSLWDYADKNYIFTYGELRCSGFVILTVARLNELWEIARKFDLVKISHTTKESIGDQLILKAINASYPELVGFSPKNGMSHWQMIVCGLDS